MRQVDVYSRKQVSEMRPDPRVCLISVWSTIALATQDYKDMPIDLTGWKDSLRQDYDDVTSLVGVPHIMCTLFSRAQAHELLRYIEGHPGEDFIVHCDAGMSRSVAIAAFMAAFYGYKPVFNVTGHDNFRNIRVFNELRRAWYDDT